MRKILIRLLIVALIVGIVVTIFNFSGEKNRYVKSRDGMLNLVRDLPDMKKSANLLSNLKRNLDGFCDYLVKKYKNDKTKSSMVKLLRKRFKPQNIQESASDSDYTSFSVNKGESIHFCLRSKDDKQKLHDMNTLMFVALHELSHVMSVSYGHNKEFTQNVKFLLREAIQNGIYRHEDYSQNNKKFCGMEITSSPLD